MLNGVAVHARSAFNGVLGSGSLVVATQSSLVQRSGTSRWVVVIGVHPRREELPKGFFSPGASCEPHGLRWRAVGGHEFWAVTVCAVRNKEFHNERLSHTHDSHDRQGADDGFLNNKEFNAGIRMGAHPRVSCVVMVVLR